MEMAHKWLKRLSHLDGSKGNFQSYLQSYFFFADEKALHKMGSFAGLTWAQIQALKRFSY